MVHGKETFERWSSRRRPTNGQFRMETEETRKTKEKPTSMRLQSDSAGKMVGKGMKNTPRNPNSVPVSSVREASGHSTAHLGGEECLRKSKHFVSTLQESEGRREVPVSSEMLNCPNNDSGKSNSNEHFQKDRREVLGKEKTREHEDDFLKVCEMSLQKGKNRSRHYQKRSRSEDLHQVGFIENRGQQRHISRKMSNSGNSSGSDERSERIRKERRTSRNTGQRRRRRSSSSEKENRFVSYKNHSSRYERRTSNVRRHDGKEDLVNKTNKRPVVNSDGHESNSEDGQHSLQRSPFREGVMSGAHINYGGNFEGGDHHVLSLSDAGTDQSKDSLRRRGRKFVSPSCSSASQGPEEVEEKGDVSVKSESALRKERRDRQKSRERHVRRREKQGQKAYYMQVNHNGKPYGDGATAWRADLNKLARALDPSVMDVREQPPTDMSTLRRRLRQNFEYSHPVDPIHIRQLVGRAVTQWRNTLWKKMDAGESPPKGFNKDVWDRLEKTRSCPSHAEKSERMKHANSCRITLGRTGPRGEEGIREMLRLKNGGSPDYDDVFTEMQRDKGYGGLASRRKKLKKESGTVGVPLRLEGVVEDLSHVPDIPVRQSTELMNPTTSTATVVQEEDDYVQKLELQIAKLQAEVAIRSKGPNVDSEKRDTRNSFDKEVNVERVEILCVGDEGEARVSKELVTSIHEGNSEGGEVFGRTGSDVVVSKGKLVVTDGRKKLRSHKG